MSDADVVAAIKANHLKANISGYEAGIDGAVIHWDRAWIDPGFGGDSGPYAKVPITLHWDPPILAAGMTFDTDEIVVRVYPPERLRRRLAKEWAR